MLMPPAARARAFHAIVERIHEDIFAGQRRPGDRLRRGPYPRPRRRSQRLEHSLARSDELVAVGGEKTADSARRGGVGDRDLFARAQELRVELRVE